MVHFSGFARKMNHIPLFASEASATEVLLLRYKLHFVFCFCFTASNIL
ncbi:MAG: hypothetical protein U5L45_07710 [Saprospiraceae bacterium]|nr:hypothetical protein [Saprospiraceae bacterium]